MALIYSEEPLHIDEVEPAVNIVKRFCTGELVVYVIFNLFKKSLDKHS